MAIFRKHKNDKFTTIDNEIFKNKELSFKAKGLLCTMLSLPDGWEFSEMGLSMLGTDNRASIRSALKELEEYNYLIRTRIRNSKGQVQETQYDIYEEPMCEKPTLEKPTYEKPTYENQHNKIINNKELINKEINNIKENKKKIPYEEIIEYLNEKAGTKYRPQVKETQRHIKARYDEGFTLEDFKKVIDNKVQEWKGTQMNKYLRPSTLFATKFENYLNQERKKTLAEMFDD